MISFAEYNNFPLFLGDAGSGGGINPDAGEKEEKSADEFSALLFSLCAALPQIPPVTPLNTLSVPQPDSAVQFPAAEKDENSFSVPTVSSDNDALPNVATGSGSFDASPVADKPPETVSNDNRQTKFANQLLLQISPINDRYFFFEKPPEKTDEYFSFLLPTQKTLAVSGEKTAGNYFSNNSSNAVQPAANSDLDFAPDRPPMDLPVDAKISLEAQITHFHPTPNPSEKSVVAAFSPAETGQTLPAPTTPPESVAKIFQALIELPTEHNVSTFPQPSASEPPTLITKTENIFPKIDVAADDVLSLEHFENAFSPSTQFARPETLTTGAAEKSLPTGVIEQIAESVVELAIQTNLLRQPQMIKLRLRPAELGTVEIKLEQTAAGKISARLITQSESTRQIFNENIFQLRDSLQQAGWQIERIEISCNSSLTAGLSHGSNSGQPQSQSTASEQQPGRSAGTFPAAVLTDTETFHSPETIAGKNNRLLSVRA